MTENTAQPAPFAPGYTQVLDVDTLWTRRADLLTRNVAHGTYPHVSAISGMRLDPPAAIEGIGRLDEVGQTINEGTTDRPLDDVEFGVGVTIWPNGEWMVDISLANYGKTSLTVTWI